MAKMIPRFDLEITVIAEDGRLMRYHQDLEYNPNERDVEQAETWYPPAQIRSVKMQPHPHGPRPA